MTLVTNAPDQWMLDQGSLGNYVQANFESTLTPTATDNPDIEFYWLYPGMPLRAKYEYCVIVKLNELSGQACSPQAVAAFNVNGVTNSSIGVVYNSNVYLNYFYGCDKFYVNYGKLHGTCASQDGDWGITFQIHGQPPEDGDFFFVQLVKNATVTYSTGGVSASCVETTLPGLDSAALPYSNVTNMDVVDAPGFPLFSQFLTGTMNATFRMYLMWQDGGRNSFETIPVPLGYVDWEFYGYGTSIIGGLEADGNGGPIAPGNSSDPFVLSDPNQPNDGEPTWDNPSILYSTCQNQP